MSTGVWRWLAGALLAGALAASPANAAQAGAGAPGQDCGPRAPGGAALALRAIAAGCAQLGRWYTWSGGHAATPGPTYGTPDGQDPASDHDREHFGFDCSGLVRYAYYQAAGADILNGDSASQYHTIHAVARPTAGQGEAGLLPGDLLVYGSRADIHHIEIYLGAGMVIAARQSGTRIAVGQARLDGDYLGAVRVQDGPVRGLVFRTWGTGVWTHLGPATDSGRVFALPGPSDVRIDCQRHAQVVRAEGTVNDAWSRLPDYGAWVTNIYITGPAWLPGVPACP